MPELQQLQTELPQNIFRAYDIRGVADTQLNESNIELIGKALAANALESGEQTLLLGADARVSSSKLKRALLKGILSTGCNVIDLGTVPTPLLYFAAYTSAYGSGLMLTASHNPAQYNGIKVLHKRSCLSPEQIQGIRVRALKGDFPEGQGSVSERDFSDEYIQRVKKDVRLAKRLRIVVDCANAVPSTLAPKLFEALGCEVFKLHCSLDGTFPNHPPDPTVQENLQELIEEVKNRKADLGVALDGDGDRVVLVTEKGNVIDTDRLLMLLIKDIAPKYQNPNIVFDVKCSTLLRQLIINEGGNPVMSRSGHSFMKQMMHDKDAVIGAEFSAHVFIKDRWFGYDDGPYAAARFLEILSKSKQSADMMLKDLPQSIVTPELRIEVSDERKFQLMERIKALAHFPQGQVNDIDGVRVDFEDGWGLVRASNTTPALLLRFEARSRQALLAIQALFRDLLREVDAKLELSF
ncbi:MAG: phosphomannomutase/phosphoglucomutase [Pseudohongiellaceae bacterium]|nr:phosphomannomutase/phosphoglucomutase [Pseudohongiellaceae bacterium]